MKKLYAYHATPACNKETIEKKGLVLNNKPISNGYYVKNQLFFTFLSAEEAEAIVLGMLADENREDDVIVYKIPLSYFDIAKVGYDYNMKTESVDMIKNFTYKCNVPACRLEITSSSDFSKDVRMADLLRNEDEDVRAIGEKLVDIFEEKFN